MSTSIEAVAVRVQIACPSYIVLDYASCQEIVQLYLGLWGNPVYCVLFSQPFYTSLH